jgi:hypothetical protein
MSALPLLDLRPCRRVFLRFLVSKVTAGNAPAHRANHRMARADEMTRDTARSGAFQTSGGIGLAAGCNGDKAESDDDCFEVHDIPCRDRAVTRVSFDLKAT